MSFMPFMSWISLRPSLVHTHLASHCVAYTKGEGVWWCVDVCVCVWLAGYLLLSGCGMVQKEARTSTGSVVATKLTSANGKLVKKSKKNPVGRRK